MTVPATHDEVLEVVELLGFVASLCADQHDALNTAIYRFTTSCSYAADELCDDATRLAGLLARSSGFDDPGSERCS